MVGWIPPYIARIQDWFIEKSADLRNHRQRAEGKPAYYPEYHPPAESELPADGSIASPPPGLFAPQSGMPLQEWVLPPIQQILDSGKIVQRNEAAEKDRARVIEETLASFGAPAKVVDTSPGPTITQFGVEPQYIESRGSRTRVRVSKIASLADDLALALSARTIRIQAPVPGKGYIGIEVPNEEVSLVVLRDVIESEAFKRLKSPLRFALGQNVAGNAMAADLSVMPHLLIAGATGSGKSVCVNALICCLLMHNTPDTLRMVMVDPKRVELTGYNGIPHLLTPVVVELEKVVTALQWILREMDARYQKLAEAGCRNIKEYNAKMTSQAGMKLPYLVVVIDELADLMMLAPDDTERSITRLAQLARATGIHMVIATQRPSVDVVTGLIKANLPARIAFAVASGVDSRVILDQPGAERLLGRGDMLFQSPDAPAPIRLQGVFVSDNEIFSLVNYWRALAGYAQTPSMAADGTPDGSSSVLPLKQMTFWEEDDMSDEPDDPLYDEAVDLVRRQGRASISMLQRRLRIGYTRSARLVEAMEDRGIVGEPHPGTGTREVLDYGPAAPPVDN
jgi:S-DNA-T family DNA segregation ATPase FtsK/SpoIIIE